MEGKKLVTLLWFHYSEALDKKMQHKFLRDIRKVKLENSAVICHIDLNSVIYTLSFQAFYFLRCSTDFPCGSAGKESTCKAGDLGSISGLGRSPGEGKGYPLQYSGLENSMDCIVHRVAKSQTRLSNFHFHLWITSSQVSSTLTGVLCTEEVLIVRFFLWAPQFLCGS